ncbi:MAG: hypothetical protein LBC53_00100 [Spirochaetaceae bacterium]|nr:hypothetical protein [Spirochaetaceae bacterium]
MAACFSTPSFFRPPPCSIRISLPPASSGVGVTGDFLGTVSPKAGNWKTGCREGKGWDYGVPFVFKWRTGCESDKR